MDLQKITSIAIQTRHDFENQSLAIPYLASVVRKYLGYIAEVHKDDLTDWIEQTIVTFPADGCELASAVLLDRIGQGKIIYGRYNHEPIGPHNARKTHAFWAQTADKQNITLIADITADQYQGPPLYIGELIYPWTTPDWSKISDGS